MDNKASNPGSAKNEQTSPDAGTRQENVQPLEQESLAGVVGGTIEFGGLPMGLPISGPLIAASDAQTMLGTSYYEDLSKPKGQ